MTNTEVVDDAAAAEAAAEGSTSAVSVCTLERGELRDCPICYEELGVIPEGGNGVVLSGVESSTARDDDRLAARPRDFAVIMDGCRHAFCRNCLTQHCRESIRAKRHPISCPQHGCRETLPEVVVEELLVSPPGQKSRYGSIEDSPVISIPLGDDQPETAPDRGNNDDGGPGLERNTPLGEDLFGQYKKIRRFSQDPTLIPCTKCHEPVGKTDRSTPGTGSDSDCESQRTPNNDDDAGNSRVCPSCGHAFCAVHGDSHGPEMTCTQYESSTRAQQIRRSEAEILEYAKPCSHCGAFLHKAQGCDHVVCPSCHDDMCFRCGTHEHLRGDMLRSCSNCEQHFIDHRHIWAYRLTLMVTFPCFIPICLLHIAISATVAVATFCCCCCFQCGYSQENADLRKEASARGQKRGLPRVFDPVFGIRMVISYVIWPLIDMARQCGCSCCCGLAPPAELMDARKQKDAALQSIDSTATMTRE